MLDYLHFLACSNMIQLQPLKSKHFAADNLSLSVLAAFDYIQAQITC